MDVTEEILSRFSQSWTNTTKFFNDLIDNNPELDRLIPLYIFIQKLKKAGGDNFFRLGTSRQELIFSRSYEPELRPDQKFISIKTLESSFVITLKDAKKMHRQYTIKDLDDERLTDMLQAFKETLID